MVLIDHSKRLEGLKTWGLWAYKYVEGVVEMHKLDNSQLHRNWGQKPEPDKTINY